MRGISSSVHPDSIASAVVEGYQITRYQFPRARIMGDSRVKTDTHYIGSLELRSSSGHVGLGFFSSLLVPLPPQAELERMFAAELAPALLGQSPFLLSNRIAYGGGRHDPPRLFDQAVDHALWDLQARVLRLPLYRLLGGSRNRVRAYISGLDFHLSLEEFRTFYTAAALRGFSAFKIKVGHPDLQWELARLKVLRQVVGPDAVVMVDSNEAWSPKEAVRRAHAYHDAGLDIYWMEDPCPRNDFEGLAYVAQAVPFTHINLGEYVGLEGKRRLLELGAVDILNVWGGNSEMLQAAALAASYGRPISVSNMVLEQGVHVAAALPAVAWLEYSVQAYDRLVEEPVRFESGYAIAPDRPGNGLMLSEAARVTYARPA